MRRDSDRQRRLRVLVRDSGNTDTTYFDETARNGRRYTYRIYALRGDEESKVSDYNARRYRRPAIPTPTPTATNTPSPTPTPTATPTPGNSPRSVQPPQKEKPGGDPPNLARQSTTEATGDILVANTGVTLATFSAPVKYAQGFTTGATPYRLTGVEARLSNVDADEIVSLGISEESASAWPADIIYDLESPSVQDGTTFFSAPESAYLKANTPYFVHFILNEGEVLLGDTASNSEDATSKQGWLIADSSWRGVGDVWVVNDSVFSITVRGVEIDTPDRAGEHTSSALTLHYSRSNGKSPYATAFLNSASDVDWFRTNLEFDAGARYRIDIEPVSLTDDADLQVSAFYADYPHDHSRDDFLELEKLTDPPEGLISYHVRVTRNHGPYIKVWADDGAIGEYRVRIVYDPVKTWADASEIYRGDLPHDDTTWATVTLGTSQFGVYHYYDDHDWFEVEMDEDEEYVIITVPPDSWLTTPDVGTVLRLYDSGGNQLAIDYSGSRLSSATIRYTVPTGEGGTYYIDVSYSNFSDDPDFLDATGYAQGVETGASPFIGSRFRFIVSRQE